MTRDHLDDCLSRIGAMLITRLRFGPNGYDQGASRHIEAKLGLTP
ncbi:hypothetical protein [Nonomuraea sp. NPDC049504]